MNWTKTPPTKPGYYLWKSDRKELRPVEVYEHKGELVAFGRNVFDSVESIGGEWSSRLVPVEEVEKAYREGHFDAGGYMTSNDYHNSRARRVVGGEEQA